MIEFFCRANEETSRSLKIILAKYENVSGQVINTAKSTVVFSSNTPDNIRELCKRQLEIPNEGGFGRYLGVPEHFGRRKKDIFMSILNRMSQKIEGWSTKLLSSAGRLVMLRSVLLAIPNYTMSCFRLPAGLCKRIKSLLIRFFWDKELNSKKIAWISWKKMAAPKALGGMGFRDIQKFNDSLLGKIGWKLITNPSTMFAKILLGKYCVTTDFMHCKLSRHASHGWRSVLAGRDVLSKNLAVTIGNGEHTKLWDDRWIPKVHPEVPFGPRTERLSDAKVAVLIDQATKTWDVEKVHHALPHLEKEILSIKLSTQGANDTIYWSGTKDGKYSPKSGYFALMEQSIQDENLRPTRTLEWGRKIWKLACPPKIRMFMWRIFHKALPVGEALLSRGVTEQGACIRCGELETLRHVALECQFAMDVWGSMQWKSPIDMSSDSIAEIILRMMDLVHLPHIGAGSGGLVPWILWSIWKARNHLIFQQREYSSADTLTKAIIDAKEWQTSQPNAKPTVPTGLRISDTIILPQNCPIMHSDAAWNKDLLTAGLGIVLTLHGQEKLLKATKDVYVISPLVAEALAIREAVSWAVSMRLTQLQIFSDSKLCVGFVNTNSGPCELYGILYDINSLSSQFSFFRVSFISRDLNSVADSIAKRALLSLVL